MGALEFEGKFWGVLQRTMSPVDCVSTLPRVSARGEQQIRHTTAKMGLKLMRDLKLIYRNRCSLILTPYLKRN